MITELLPREGLVLCAVSGGADSMYLLARLRELGCRVAAATYDHGLRGERSRRDAEFVAAYCGREGILCVPGRGDVGREARERGLGIEEAARLARYAFLERTADRLGAAVIATAHTADDNAETVLMRLMRGAGARGLGGIPPVRGRIVRPMLDVTREEVLSWLEARGIPHVEDETNAGDAYLRNRVRHRILPAIRRENPAFSAAAGRTARLLREDDALLEELAARELERLTRAGGNLDAPGLLTLPPALARRVLRRAAGSPLTLEETDRVLALLPGGGRAFVGGQWAQVSAGLLRFGPGPGPALPERSLTPGTGVLLPEAGLRALCEKIPGPFRDVHSPFNTFLFSCENICGTMLLTARRPGDAFRPLGRGCTKTLKALFREAGVPTWERDRLPVLRDDAGILAVPGFPPDERCAPCPDSRECVRVSFLPLAEEGAQVF